MERLHANGIAELNGLQRGVHSALSYGLDVVVHAETGAGKTLAFGLPLLAKLEEGWRNDAQPALQAVVVAPTLELSAQISRVLNTLEPGVSAALSDDTDELPAAPVVVGPPALLLRLLSEPGSVAATPKRGRPGGRSRALDDVAWDDETGADLEAAMRPAQSSARLQRAAVAKLRFAVLDEADALLTPLSKYATVQQKLSRAAHPKEAATLLSLLCAERGDALQVAAASATVGRPLRRQLASLSGRPSFEVVRGGQEVVRGEDPGHAAAMAAATVESRGGGGGGGGGGGAVRAVGLPAQLDVRVVTSDADNVLAAVHEAIASAGLPRTSSPLLFVPWGRGVRTELRLLRQCGLPHAAPLADHLGDAALTAPRGDGAGAGDARVPPAGEEEGEGERAPLLVAAPSAARGLDVHNLELVVVMGVPPSADHFLHLAGRTARNGARGTVVLVTTPEESRKLPALGAQLGLDFGADERHVQPRNEEWARQWAVHQKIVNGGS